MFQEEQLTHTFFRSDLLRSIFSSEFLSGSLKGEDSILSASSTILKFCFFSTYSITI